MNCLRKSESGELLKYVAAGMMWLQIILFTSCKNDIETIKALTSEVKYPNVTAVDVEMSYTDSGLLKGKIYAPEVYQYNMADEPYYEFPKGMKAVIFDSSSNYNIRANYGIYYYEKQLWEGRNHVLIDNNITGEKVETEELFWDQKARRIYSDKYTKVTNQDGVFVGENGFESDDSFKKVRMIGYSGNVTLEDDKAVPFQP